MKPASFLTTILVLTVLLAPPSLGAHASAAAAGPRCYVDASAGAGANNGTSWGNAYTSLQAALADLGCTEIWMAAGTYKPTEDLDRSASFILRDGVAIYGGFMGGETLFSQRDFDTNYVFLSGDLKDDDAAGFAHNSDNSLHVVKGGGIDTTSILDGLSIVGGNADAASYPDNAGGGLFDDSSTLTLNNVIFTVNSANLGAGLFNYYSSSTLSNVIFVINHSSGDGGGLGALYSDLRADNLFFITNKAVDEGGGLYIAGDGTFTLDGANFDGNTAAMGGGMTNLMGTNTALSNVTFQNNSATAGGGGMFNDIGTSTLSDMIFTTNSAPFGGGMYISNSNPTLSNVTFEDNSTTEAGAGIYLSHGSPHLTDVTFSGNTARGNGGGLCVYSASSLPVLTSVTFAGNSARSGGGIYNYQGALTVTDSLFDGNTASGTGGGSGGGVLIESGTIDFTRVTFNGNHALIGGGLNTYHQATNLTDVTFSNNEADYGAGLYNTASQLTLSSATFSGNISLNDGGGIYNNNSEAATVDLTNVTLSGNTAQNGGGIYNNGPLTLTNTTFDANTASTNGGGIFTQTAMTIDDTILWGDSAPLYNNGSDSVTINDSIVQGGACPSAGLICSNISSDFPYLDPLQDNSGYTETMAITNGNSYALDHGNNATCADTDQRGTLRPQDGNLDGDPVCDIGAYELQLRWYLFLPLINK